MTANNQRWKSIEVKAYRAVIIGLYAFQIPWKCVAWPTLSKQISLLDILTKRHRYKMDVSLRKLGQIM